MRGFNCAFVALRSKFFSLHAPTEQAANTRRVQAAPDGTICVFASNPTHSFSILTGISQREVLNICRTGVFRL